MRGRLRHWQWRPHILVIGCEPNAVGVSQGGEPKRFHVFRGGSPSPTVRAERVDWVIATMPAEAVERCESCGAAEWLRVSGVCHVAQAVAAGTSYAAFHITGVRETCFASAISYSTRI